MIEETSTKTFIDSTNLTIANRFVKIYTVNSNSMHNIVKVYDKLSEKEIVLKIVKDFKNESLLKEEFKFIVRLNSPYIIRVYEYYKFEDYAFYSMEFEESYFNLKNIKTYIENILNAFEYLHKRKIVHDDIKKNNFIFTKDKAILIDFSKAGVIHSLSDLYKENLILSRFLIQWINYNLKIDFIGDKKSAIKFLGEDNVKRILKMFYNEYD